MNWIGNVLLLLQSLSLAAPVVSQPWTGHDGTVTAVAWSPNGKLVASAGMDGRILVWDATTGRLQRSLHGNAHTVYQLVFTDDHRLVSGGGESNRAELLLWNVESGSVLSRMEGHRQRIWRLALSHDRTTLASCDLWGDEILLWDAASGRCGSSISAWRQDGSWQLFRSVAFCPDGMVVAGTDQRTHFFKDGEYEVGFGIPHTHGFCSMTTRSHFVAMSSGNGFALFTIKEKNKEREVNCSARSCPTYCAQVLLSPDGKRLAMIRRGCVSIFETEPLRPLAHAKDLEADDLAFSPDGKRLAVATWRRIVILDVP